MRPRVFGPLVLTAFLGAVTSLAGLWQDVYLGLDYVATPTGSPISTLSDGTRVNGARSGRVRIVPNGVFGKGWRLEFDRRFGADSTGRPETLRFGALGALTLQGAMQSTLGYTHTGDKLYLGTGDFVLNNLSYDLRTKLGVQDAELSGTLNATGRLEVNTLGFYDLTLNVSNTNSQLLLDGVVVKDEKTTNFDVGPIVINGNIFYDGFLGLLASTGVDISELAAATPGSPIGEIAKAMRLDSQAGQVVAGETAQADFAPLLLQTVLGGDEDAAERLMQGILAAPPATADSQTAQPAATLPEPGTLLLIVAGAISFRRVARR